jgi:rhodanese-related sulfurtransferase
MMMIIKLMPVLAIALVTMSLNAQQIASSRLSAYDFLERIEEFTTSEAEFEIIDVRTIQEFNAGHIENSLQIDFYAHDFAAKLDELPKDKQYLIYCRSGRRTGITLQIMQKLNFKNVADLNYGIKSWMAENLELITE